MKKLLYILSLVVIIMMSFLINDAQAKSIYDLVGKSYNGCEIIDVVQVGGRYEADRYMIICMRGEGDNAEIVKYETYGMGLVGRISDEEVVKLLREE